MKLCPTCGVEKPLSDYYRRGSSVQPYCKPCVNIYCSARWTQRKIDAVESMGGKCADCSGVFHYAVYEFHHLDPMQKEYGWHRLRLRSAETIRDELRKCVLLCANCHRIRHANEMF